MPHYQVTLQPSGHRFTVAAEETVLTGAQRHGYRLPHSCDNGVCERCEARLLSGRAYQQRGAGAPTPIQSRLLCCIAYPQTDLTLELPGVLAPGEYQVKKLACQVASMQLLNDDVYRIFLRTPAGHPLQYHAGQYLEILLPDGERAAFSIGNAPNDRRELELHILHLPHRKTSDRVIRLLQEAPVVQVELPKGDCYLTTPDGNGPLVFVAAGTGFSQMKAMLEAAFAQGLQQPLYLYWGVRKESDLYLPQLPEAWQQAHDNFHFRPVVENASDTWQGRRGMLHDAIVSDLPDLSQAQVYASGSPGMVYAVMDHLVEFGLQEDRIFSDVFSYAPRDAG